tara:strand:- start:1463 stop:1810 length:348 start_codon:yes stop_codon:yes gene_type:complete
LPARPSNPWLTVHALYAAGILAFFAIFQMVTQSPETGDDWARFAVEVGVKTVFLHVVFWIILIRPSAAAYRRVAATVHGEAQRERLDREVTVIAVLDKRFQSLERELKRRHDARE